jgi:hypothetical protein
MNKPTFTAEAEAVNSGLTVFPESPRLAATFKSQAIRLIEGDVAFSTETTVVTRTGCDGGGIQGGMNFENRGQLRKLQQFADEIAGGSQRDRALARLRRQGNRNKCSEASGVDHFHPAEVDHHSAGLGRKLGNLAG